MSGGNSSATCCRAWRPSPSRAYTASSDGYFVGNRLGDLGLAAINLAYPVAAFFSAVGTGIGLAGAIRFAITALAGA